MTYEAPGQEFSLNFSVSPRSYHLKISENKSISVEKKMNENNCSVFYELFI